jgi:hypothetical protein
MKRYMIHKDGKLIGGMELTSHDAKMLRANGYTLLSA